MSDGFLDDLPNLYLDDPPDIMGDLPISRPCKKSKRRDAAYPAVSLFGTQEDASKVLRALDEWLDTDRRICGWREIVDTALHKIEVHEAQWEDNRDRCFPLDLLRSNLRGQKLDEVLRGNHQIIRLLGTRYSQGHVRDFNAMLRDFEQQRARYRSDHPWPFIGPPRELDLHETDDVRMICLVVGFWHDVLVHGYSLLTDQQAMSFRCFPYPPYRISVTNLEGHLIHIKRLLKAKGILGAVGHDTEPQVTAAKSKKPRISRKEASTKVREMLKQKPDVEARDLSKEIGCENNTKPKVRPKRKSKHSKKKGNIKKSFKFEPGRVMYNGDDLNLPSGEPVEICEELINNFDHVVPYTKFDKYYSSATPGTLPKSIDVIRNHFKKHKVPCVIKSIRGEGYVIKPAEAHRPGRNG